jgi:hypothetical protein
LVAYAQPTHEDGTFDNDRAGRPKVRSVQLRTEALFRHLSEDALSVLGGGTAAQLAAGAAR